MKRLTVIIAPAVEDQITAHVFRIAADSVDNALAWEDRIRTAIDNIGDAPGLAIDEAGWGNVLRAGGEGFGGGDIACTLRRLGWARLRLLR